MNTTFYFQIDDQTKRQNQTLKYFFRVYCNDEQINWIVLLSLTEFVYQNAVQSTLNKNSFFCMYDYNSKIRYEIENNFISKKMSTATERMKRLHEFRDELTQRWKHVVVAQIKYYNKKHLSKNFKIENLIILSTKNLKQKNQTKNYFINLLNRFA